MVDIGEEISKMPKWVLPVGVGGLVGVGFLLSKGGKKPTPTGLIPVTPGETDDDGETTDWLAEFGTTLTDLIGESNQQMAALIASDNASENEQMATFLENLTSLQSGTMDTVTELITAQAGVNAANNANILALIQAFTESMSDQIEDITDIISHPPTTGVATIIDGLKKLFATAFERVPKPFGVQTPNSDITIGDLGAAAPYKQDSGFTYYDTTGHFVTGPFRQFLGNFGGAKTYGRPLSQVFRDHDGYDTQVFSHAIFKYIPGADPSRYDIVVVPII
jgi:hypothetical protein